MNDLLTVIVILFVLFIAYLILADVRRKPKRRKFKHTPGQLADIQQRLFDISSEEDNEI